MKLGVITDTHLGLRQYGLMEREEDFYDQFQRAIDVFISSEVDVVIIGGDIFDKPRPSPKALKVFSNGINKLNSSGIKVCNVIGNHAMVQSSGFVTADEFIKTVIDFDFRLLDIDSYYETADVFIAGLPYHFNYETNDLIEKVSELNIIAGEKDKTSILVLHQSFKEFCGFAGEELSIEDLNVSNFNLVICGHIHEKKIQDISNNTVFLQPGSLERSSVAEARDEEVNGKGVFIIDTNKMDSISISNSFYRIKSPRKFLIADMYMNEESDVEDIKNEILSSKGDCDVPPVLFLSVHDVSNSFNKLMDMTKDINQDFLTVNFKYFDENPYESSEFISEDGEIPTPREALKIALNPMDKDEARLGLDLYDVLKDGGDAQQILDNFLDKRMKTLKEEESLLYNDEELREIEEFFENL